MRTASLFCALAMLFYALEIALTDWKLSNISPRFLTFCFSLGVAICAAVMLAFDRGKIVMPQGYQWIFILLMIASSFVAALAHFEALHRQSGAVMLAMFYCLMPVAASFYTALFKSALPNYRVMLAWLVAALALYLLTTGEK